MNNCAENRMIEDKIKAMDERIDSIARIDQISSRIATNRFAKITEILKYIKNYISPIDPEFKIPFDSSEESG